MRFALVLFLVIALVGLRIAFAQQPATKPAAPILENRLKPLPPETPAGPFVLLDDGAIVAVKDDAALISRDGGTNWERHALFAAGAYKVRPEYAIVRTKDGAVVVVFIDDLVKQWKWDNEKNTSAVAEPILYVWSTRSTDGGKTWSPPVKVQDGYCGAVRDMIETRDGTLVVPLQKYLPEHSRHATTPFYSTDGGLTWKSAGVLDIGGRGHHDGSIESTVVERRDGKLWMILRTCDDYFAQSFSTDSGKTWSEITPTTIDASSSPAIVKRLASGRLAMAWNRLYPKGKEDYPRRAGQHSAKAASWHREELSLAFSDDDGKSWTKPAVVARVSGARVSYPFIFEPRPGVIWLTTMQGGLRAQLNETEFPAAISPGRSSTDKSQPTARRDDHPPMVFSKNGTVFNVGESTAFDANWTTAPTVVRERDRYRMWYSGYFTSREGEGGIGVAESADGITWQRSPAGAIFDKGAPGAFDSELVFAPEVLFDGTTYRMYFTGQSNRQQASNIVTYQIGLATSSDGITWRRENGGRPIVENGPTDSPDEVQAATPTIVKTADGYRMWYAAWSPKFNHTICVARSNDGINWTRENNGAPVEGLSPSIAYGPAVTKVGERFYMLYMALSATRNLYAAVSDDGLKWQMLNGGAPLIATGEKGSFDSDIVGHPFLMHEDGKLRAWYTGYQKTGATLADWTLRIGLAEAIIEDQPATRDVPADGIIAESGTYKLASDMLVDRDLGIQINADNVTLDLNGHALRNTAPPQPKSRGIISSGQRNIRITNGTVGGFWFNVHCASVTDLIVKDVKFDDIPYIGVNVARGNDVEISDCSFSNFRYDIEKRAKSTYLIGVNVSANDARVTSNRFDARPPTGTGTKLALETVGVLFRPGEKCAAVDNEITSTELLNRGYGVWVAGDTSAAVTSNRIRNFQYGVTVAGDGSADISRNRISIDPATNRDPEIESIGISAAAPRRISESDNEFSALKTEKNIAPATRPS